VAVSVIGAVDVTPVKQVTPVVYMSGNGVRVRCCHGTVIPGEFSEKLQATD